MTPHLPHRPLRAITRVLGLAALLALAPALHAQWTFPNIGGSLPNSATSLGGDCFELVNNTNERGVVWNNNLMDLSQPFDITLLVWNDVHGADGLAFVLQNSGLGAHGAGGNANGYATAVPASAYPGINPSVAVELDLFFNNVAGVNDISADHLAIHVNGDLSAAAAGPTAAIPNGNPVADGTCTPLRIRWQPAPLNSMEVYYNGQLRITWTQDIVNNIFGGNPNVNWGLTASCGSVFMTQRVCVGANFTNAGPDRTICRGDTIHLNATGADTYQWTTGAPYIANQNIPNPVFTGALPVTVTLPVIGTNILGCTDRDTAIITIRDTPTVAITIPGTACAGEPINISAGASGGPTPFTYAWSTGGTTQAITDTPTPGVQNTYTVTVTNGGGCSSVASATISIAPTLSIDILSNDTALCLGNALPSVNLTTSAGIDTYAWTPTTGVQNPSQPTSALTPTVSTTYVLTGTNTATGCTTADSIHIDVFALAVSHFTDTTVCQGDTLAFDIQPTLGSGSYLVTWTQAGGDLLSDDSIAAPFLIANNNGLYTANVLDLVSGCTASVNIDVEVIRVIVLANPTTALINPGQRVQLEASGALFYTWDPDTMLSCGACPSPVSMPSASITYTVTGTDINGCTGTATVSIITDSLVVPNVFSPNGDGINDVLELNYHGSSFYEIAVYDRWGVLMFTTQDPLGRWDGLNRSGQPVPEGVYYLAVRVIGDEAIPSKDKQRVFAVTLLR